VPQDVGVHAVFFCDKDKLEGVVLKVVLDTLTRHTTLEGRRRPSSHRGKQKNE